MCRVFGQCAECLALVAPQSDQRTAHTVLPWIFFDRCTLSLVYAHHGSLYQYTPGSDLETIRVLNWTQRSQHQFFPPPPLFFYPHTRYYQKTGNGRMDRRRGPSFGSGSPERLGVASEEGWLFDGNPPLLTVVRRTVLVLYATKQRAGAVRRGWGGLSLRSLHR